MATDDPIRAREAQFSARIGRLLGLDPSRTYIAIGLTRSQQLKALGNGVVPQQAALAIRTLLG